MNPLKNDSCAPQIECPSCGSKNVSSATEVEHFQYGDKENAAMLSASIRVHHCASCDLTFTTEETSERRHEAVCHHLGVLTPTEILEIRERYTLSQAEFSELSKIGRASLARWESGALIQNPANDNLLYLLTFQDNVARLRDRARHRNTNSAKSVPNVIHFRPKFRALPDSEAERLKSEAERFQLFPSAMVG